LFGVKKQLQIVYTTAAYHNKRWWRTFRSTVLTSMTLNDRESPKQKFLLFVFDFWLQFTHLEWTVTKWTKIEQNNLRTGTAIGCRAFHAH